MQTVAYLDVVRRQQIERAMNYHRRAVDIQTDQHSHNLVYRWPKTGSYTLFPVNLSTDFIETKDWDFLKLTLADFEYDPDYWQTVYEGQRGDIGQFDPWMHCIVKASNLPDGYPYAQTSGGGLVQAAGGYILSNVNDIAMAGIQIAQQNLASDNGVTMLQSNSTWPANQGWFLRFHPDGRQSYKRGIILDFLFGEFLLRFDSNGVAWLQANDGTLEYTTLLTFMYSDAAHVHGWHHNIAIFPHARQHIEILSQIQYVNWREVIYDDVFTGGKNQTHYGDIYTLPGQPSIDESTGQYPITQGNQPIAVRVHREFRPYLQISQLAFFDGSGDVQAFLYDTPWTLDFPPSVLFSGNIDCDIPQGTAASVGLVDPNTHQFWAVGGSNQISFYVQMMGAGDLNDSTISSDITASTVSPEFYGYILDKPPQFQVIGRGTLPASPLSTEIDFGEEAESERATITLDNSFGDELVDSNGVRHRNGQLESFSQRGDIPITILNLSPRMPPGSSSSGPLDPVVMFEGRSVRTESRESLPRQITLECQGLIEGMSRFVWDNSRPNFGFDPGDPQARGMFMSEAVYRMFEACGVSRVDVNIEQLEKYDFRLWAESGGGSRGAAKNSAGHLPSATNGIMPQPGTHCLDTLKTFLGHFIGWHFSRDRRNGVWSVYKRPHPFVSDELALMKPVFSFYCDKASAYNSSKGSFGSNLPAYFHSDLKIETIKPKFSHLVLTNGLPESGVPDLPPLNLQNFLKSMKEHALQDVGISSTTPVDPSIVKQPRQIVLDLANAYCYQEQYNPNPGQGAPTFYNPDWLGEIRFGVRATALPNRECMEWYGRMAYYALCWGQQAATWTADWGDPITAYLRKWDIVTLDTGPNYEPEWWFIDRISPNIVSDANPRAQYRANKFRSYCPPPY